MRRLLLSALLAAACGSSSASRDPASPTSESLAESAPTTSSPEPALADAPAEATAPAQLPTNCFATDSVCAPDPTFAARVCGGSYPDVALVLLAKDTPFTRLYLRGNVDGWNADGGMSTRAKLVFEEEVLVLKRRTPPTNGIIVGTGGSYLVMRWDGNCYTLDDGEVTAKRPPSPKAAAIPWRLYSNGTRDALLKSAKVLAAYQRRGKECKGVTSGEVTHACEQADGALSAAVVAEIRGGASIPTPERVP
jgi:hypothetical protein